MQIRLHKNATTTPAQRAFIQNHPNLSTSALAEKIGVSKTTVRRWRNRSSVYDRSHTPKHINTALSLPDEVAVILCRMATRAGLDDLHKMIDIHMGIHCSRASLNRCLRRYHISRLPSLNRQVPFKLIDYTGTYFYYNCYYLPHFKRASPPIIFHTLLDCSFRFFHAGSAPFGQGFLGRTLGDFPMKVLGIIHENPVNLTQGTDTGLNQSHAQMVESFCCTSNMEYHRLNARSPQTLEQLNTACKILQRHDDLPPLPLPWLSGTELSQQICRYNNDVTLGALNQKTPVQAMEEHYIEFPGSFRQNPAKPVIMRTAS